MASGASRSQRPGYDMKPKTIFDVGMNNGDDTAYYLHKGFNVVAVEANPHLVDKATSRFQKEIKTGRLTILNVGIAEEEGTLPFWICDTHSEWSSFHRNVASRDGSVHHEICVPCRRFESILEEFGVPYYLKVDIEGNDRLCLESLRNGPLAEYVSVEVSDLTLVDLLADLGYTRFKCISQFYLLALELPPTAQQLSHERARRWLESRNPLVRILLRLGARQLLERRKHQSRREADWVFPFGSSGPFGESLPGRWLSNPEMHTTFEAFHKMMQAGQSSPFWTEKDYSFWVDFHATR
jgi:FkbM family methyltransferase